MYVMGIMCIQVQVALPILITPREQICILSRKPMKGEPSCCGMCMCIYFIKVMVPNIVFEPQVVLLLHDFGNIKNLSSSTNIK